MINELPPAWERLLDRLMESPTPISLKDLTNDGRVALSPASIHRNLMAMVTAGIVRREGERKNAVYAPVEHVEVAWMAKLGDHWRRMVWRTEPPIDWRYPLVGRIGDEQARGVITRFLNALEDEGLTRPWTLADDWMQRQDLDDLFEHHMHPVHETAKKDLQRWLADRRNHAGVTVIVYGSCARGDMRPDSDVDLLVIAPYFFPVKGSKGLEAIGWRRKEPLLEYRESVLDIAADINLGASRVLDITFVGRDASGFTVPTSLRKDIREDGVTVFSTQGEEEFVEGWPENMRDD